MIEALFILSVAVAVLCALIATFAARKCVELNKQAMALCTALSNERGRIAAHDVELDQITETLRKLSGRIGAVRKEAKHNEGSPGEPGNVTDINRLTWKAQMREKYGLTTVRK